MDYWIITFFIHGKVMGSQLNAGKARVKCHPLIRGSVSVLQLWLVATHTCAILSSALYVITHPHPRQSSHDEGAIGEGTYYLGNALSCSHSTEESASIIYSTKMVISTIPPLYERLNRYMTEWYKDIQYLYIRLNSGRLRSRGMILMPLFIYRMLE